MGVRPGRRGRGFGEVSAEVEDGGRVEVIGVDVGGKGLADQLVVIGGLEVGCVGAGDPETVEDGRIAVRVDHFYSIAVGRREAFGASESNTLLPEGDRNRYRWCSKYTQSF